MTAEASRLEENKELVRRYTEEVFNEQNYDVIDEVLAEDLIDHNPALPMEITSPAEFKEAVKTIHSAFPDFEAPIEDIIAEGDRVVTRTREMGTHEGTFAGVPPTGESVEVQGINIYRIEDGRIAEMWIQVDTMGLMGQLGVVEPPGE
jgi:steroid delta-isomerase-like uncharacterized protein